MKIINLTPHALHIRRVDGTDITIEPSGIVPRLEVSRADCDPVACEDGVEIEVSRATFGALTGMPPVTDRCHLCDTSWADLPATFSVHDTCPASRMGGPHQWKNDIFVVSALCAQSPELVGRTDVYAPGEALRDSAGKIIGCTGLSLINPLAGAR